MTSHACRYVIALLALSGAVAWAVPSATRAAHAMPNGNSVPAIASGAATIAQRPSVQAAPAGASSEGITRANVTRIIATLSSDKMQGRNAFTPSIWKAAEYISGKFKQFGLEPLRGDDGYLQRFPMYSVSLRDAQVTVGGKAVPNDDYFAMVNGKDVTWTPSDHIAVKEIKKGESLMTALRGVFRSKGDVIVFVDPSFARNFQRFKGFFSGPSRVFDKDKGANKVFILADKAAQFHIVLKKKVDKVELANVAGKIEGERPNQIVVFSAHYDHLGILKPVNGDSIANGANDDASGTAAVIQLAKFYSQREKPVRTIIFVAFTAEEEGGYGSRYFSEQLDPDKIVAMFNIEMIGKPSKWGPNVAWITGFDRSTFGKILQKNIHGMDFRFEPDPYPKQHLFYRSDNATLARLGVPAHSISTTQIDIDRDYHQVTDEIGTLDLASLTNTIKAIAKASEGIVSGRDTPTRIDPATVQ